MATDSDITPASPDSGADDRVDRVGSTEHLIAFLRDRDASCPACGYNLRDLRTPICPECRQHLHLTVGLEQPRVGLLIAAVAPCIFSGIAAVLLAFPLFMVAITGGPPQPTSIILTDIFGFVSGVAGLAIIAKRRRFLRQRIEAQRAWVITLGFIHFAAFGLLVFYVMYYA